MNLRPTGPVVPLVGGAVMATATALVVAVAGSCAPGLRAAGQARPTAASPSGKAVASRSPAVALAPMTVPGYSPVEPVIRTSFADPTVIKVGGTYYAYGTNAVANMPVASAPTITGPWRRQTSDGLVRLPSWAVGGRTWAPEVVPPDAGNGQYVLYFSASREDDGKQCIGVATSSSPAGPFVALQGDPLVCPLDLGGAIDPSSFIERDGVRYLLYKTDARATAAIYLVRLSPDGLYLAGPPRKIMDRGPDEPVLVESPALVHRGGKYILLYSAGWYFQTNYQTRYAVADTLNGPYVKAAEPLQSTDTYGGKIKGPGGAAVIADGAGDHLVFHGLLEFHGGSSVTRGMFVAALGWDGARPVLRGIPARYEAEAARPGPCAAPSDRPRASGGRALGPFAGSECRAELDVTAPETGRYTVKVRYANRSGAEAVQELTVNGRSSVPVRLAETRGDDWSSSSVRIDLLAGRNTLGFRQIAGQGQLDYVEIE